MNDPTNISILKNSSFITTYIEIRFQNLKIRNYLILRWKKNIFNFIKTSRREGERPGTTFFIQFHWSSIFSFSCDSYFLNSFLVQQTLSGLSILAGALSYSGVNISHFQQKVSKID